MKRKLLISITCLGAILILFGFILYTGIFSESTVQSVPFSTIIWTNTLDDIIALEGKNYSTYDSVYGGLCYTYPKEYLGRNGTIKYMTDENYALACIAWTYTSDDTEDLYALYDEINKYTINRFGESGYNPQNSTNYGNVWYREEGNIIISTMLTSTNKALQYAYLNPVVSSEAPDKKE